MSRARSTTALALALAAVACGKGGDRPPDRAPAPAPAPLDAASAARAPVAPPAPRMMPTFVTRDEVKAHLPALERLRTTGELAIDPSGKQATVQGCLTATEPKVGMHAVADAFGVARWNVKQRVTSQGDRRAELTGEYLLHDGTLAIRGVLAAAPGCAAGEVGLTLSFSKLVDVPRVAPPTPPPEPGTPGRALTP